MRTKKAALIYNKDKKETTDIANKLLNNNFNLPVDFYVLQSDDLSNDCLKKDTDFILVLGGDGTFLRAARLTFGKDIPLYGVNFGRLGFLATGDVATLKEDIEKILQGRYTLTKRDIVKGVVHRNGKIVNTVYALNDIVISKTSISRMTDLQVSVNNELLSIFRSDGIILSTPTGSTAYALSAGGPIIPPDVSCLLLVPICAHTLFARPVVLNGKDKTIIKVLGNNAQLTLTQDGQVGYELLEGDIIEAGIEKDFKVYTIEPEGNNYYDLLRRKLSWGFVSTKGEIEE